MSDIHFREKVRRIHMYIHINVSEFQIDTWLSISSPNKL